MSNNTLDRQKTGTVFKEKGRRNFWHASPPSLNTQINWFENVFPTLKLSIIQGN